MVYVHEQVLCYGPINHYRALFYSLYLSLPCMLSFFVHNHALMLLLSVFLSLPLFFLCTTTFARAFLLSLSLSLSLCLSLSPLYTTYITSTLKPTGK